MPKFVLLWTDATVWLLIAGLCVYAVVVARSPALSANWRKVFRDAPALGSSVLLMLCLVITLLDSLHYRPLLPPAAGATHAAPAYESRTRSVLDAVLSSLVDSREATYSRPLAYVGFTKESVEVNGQIDRVAPRLKHGGAHLTDPAAQWAGDVTTRILKGLVFGLLFTVATAALLFAVIRVMWSCWSGLCLQGERHDDHAFRPDALASSAAERSHTARRTPALAVAGAAGLPSRTGSGHRLRTDGHADGLADLRAG